MEENNVRPPVHDSRGRFAKGNNANPKGNNQFTTIVPLIKALEEHGKTHGQDFWKMIAEKCYGTHNESLLIAVLKKILPDKIANEGLGDTKIIIVREKNSLVARAVEKEPVKDIGGNIS